MSGGKGGSQSTSSEIPDWAKEPTIRNIARAEQAQQVGYQPYYGLDVAAFNPTQEAAMQMNVDTARAFGMMPTGYENLTGTQGMPQAQQMGGLIGYSSAPLYEQALASARVADPTQADIYESLFTQDTGYTPKVG